MEELKPDLITLDIEMPLLDGLSTLKELKKRGIKYPVIMLSSLTKEGSIQTMKCLEYGAVDFVEKSGGISASKEMLKETLVDKIKGIIENNNILTTMDFLYAKNEMFKKAKLEPLN